MCVFVASKVDLQQREVGREYGQELGARHGVQHREVCLTGDLNAIEEVVADVTIQVLAR